MKSTDGLREIQVLHDRYLVLGVANGVAGEIYFQDGAIQDVGVNGCQISDLIQICLHRLQGFQAGAFACRENALAITKLEEALMWLEKRRQDRIERGVEGKEKP